MRYAALALTIALIPVDSTAQDFSIEQILSTSMPSELVTSPRSNAVAWVSNAEGVRNVWFARGPEYSGRQVTSYTMDDGQEIINLIISPDGRRIVFVRGGAPNRQGEIPTPTSSPDWAEREIWVVSSGGGDPKLLAEGASPALSPDARTIAFVKSGQVWSVPIGGGDAEQMFTIRGGAASLRWAPDGDRIAFTSGRGDHSFVGVFDPGQQSVTYLAPSVDRDGQPGWSPDGAEIAFIRTPNVRAVLPFEPNREGHPWSILVADPQTGLARTVWTAREGPGSVFKAAAYSDRQLLWGAGDRLVFPWEGNGWTNLYSVAAHGPSDVRSLTEGHFEVETTRLTPNGVEVLYSSNQNDIDRRHVWRVPVSGRSRPRLVTPGQGIEWSPGQLEDGSVAFMQSGARQPARAAISMRGEIKPLGPDADRNAGVGVVPQGVTIAGADGVPVNVQLFLPPNIDVGDKRPALIFFHGGSRRQMLLGYHSRGYYHNAYALNQYFASRGYVVISVNYRSGTGYGLNFREADNYGANGASEFNDVLGAGLYLRSRSDVDPNRIGLWGGSYGGYLTALGLARASDLFAAGVDVHGVHDWNEVVRGFRPDYNPEARAEWARVAFDSSPMAHLDGWRSPVLVIHGDDDRNVPFSETVDLVESLRERDVEVEQLIFPDEVHGFLLHRNWVAAYKATADFFERKLMNRKGVATGSSR